MDARTEKLILSLSGLRGEEWDNALEQALLVAERSGMEKENEECAKIAEGWGIAKDRVAHLIRKRMEIQMNEIPEWAIRDAEKSLKGIYPEMVSPQAFLYLRETIARAILAQMEADCRAVCERCADPEIGNAVLKDGMWLHPPYNRHDWWTCSASKIRRAAAEATRTGEGERCLV